MAGYGSTAPYGQLRYKGELGGGGGGATGGLELYPDVIRMGAADDNAAVYGQALGGGHIGPPVHCVNDGVAAGLWPERIAL